MSCNLQKAKRACAIGHLNDKMPCRFDVLFNAGKHAPKIADIHPPHPPHCPPHSQLQIRPSLSHQQ